MPHSSQLELETDEDFQGAVRCRNKIYQIHPTKPPPSFRPIPNRNKSYAPSDTAHRTGFPRRAHFHEGSCHAEVKRVRSIVLTRLYCGLVVCALMWEPTMLQSFIAEVWRFSSLFGRAFLWLSCSCLRQRHNMWLMCLVFVLNLVAIRWLLVSTHRARFSQWSD